jgi:hypothetical protein
MSTAGKKIKGNSFLQLVDASIVTPPPIILTDTDAAVSLHLL